MDSPCCSRLVIEVRPWLAAPRVCCAWPIWSSSEDSELARLVKDCEVKKDCGLSNALVTFLPVARRFCVVVSKEAVLCSDSRFCRTPAERVMSDIGAYLSGYVPYTLTHCTV